MSNQTNQDQNRLDKLNGFFKNELKNNKDISIYDDNTAEEQTESKEEIIKRAKPDKNNYKSVRLYPEDYEILRTIGFYENKPLIEVVSDAINFYERNRT